MKLSRRECLATVDATGAAALPGNAADPQRQAAEITKPETYKGPITDGRYRPPVPPVFQAFKSQLPVLEARGWESFQEYQSLEEAMQPAYAAGVERIVFTGRDDPNHPFDNKFVAECVKAMPDRIVGVAGVDERDEKAVMDKIRMVKDLGLKGISMDSPTHGFKANDKDRMFPIYELCLELDLAVFLTCGPLPYPDQFLEDANPIYVDAAAQAYPELRLVASHSIFPWTQEWIATAWKNKNVYLETSVYMDLPGVKQYMGEAANQIIGDKIIFASGYPIYPVKRAVEQILTWGIMPEKLPLIFNDNVARALKLDKEV